jgi:uncharacterized membrane protein YhaH (DUF805 family)
VISILQLWLGVTRPVGRTAYALSGLGLMALKYAVEALAIWSLASAAYWPWHFLNPLVSLRTQMLQGAPPWVGWALVAWSLPFVWIALSMSVRRAADAGSSPWLGLLVLVPVVNLVFMLAMCLVPSAGRGWTPHVRAASDEALARSAALALGISLMIGGAMLLISVYLLESYGGALFFGTPLVMGAVAAYLHNREFSRTYLASIGLGMGAVLVAGIALLLFALEGVICVAMALPLTLPMGALGGAIGKAIADASADPRGLLAALALLPLMTLVEGRLNSAPEYVVRTAVEIDAPPQVVWRHVVDFPQLPPPRQWYFRVGIACPERAEIFGQGVGAVRHCVFTTGTFVEPISAWEPGRRLAFDVTSQPAPLFELTPYRHLHPPHLDGYLRSQRGEFLLVVLPDGRTRLEGRTWYQFDMFPQAYWTLWSQTFIHAIHRRVLEHVQQLAEQEARGTAGLHPWRRELQIEPAEVRQRGRPEDA